LFYYTKISLKIDFNIDTKLKITINNTNLDQIVLYKEYNKTLNQIRSIISVKYSISKNEYEIVNSDSDFICHCGLVESTITIFIREENDSFFIKRVVDPDKITPSPLYNILIFGVFFLSGILTFVIFSILFILDYYLIKKYEGYEII
jgi:hypothetical protein